MHLNLEKLISSIPDPDPKITVYKLEVPSDQIDMAELRSDSEGMVSRWINSPNAVSWPSRKSVVMEDLVGLGGGLDGTVNIDPDLTDGPAGYVDLSLRTGSDGSHRIWMRVMEDQTVDLRSGERFIFDPTKLESSDLRVFLRELMRHPNHAVMLAFWTHYCLSRRLEPHQNSLQHCVAVIRRTKRGLLQAVLARSKTYADIESVIMSENRSLAE